MKRMLSILSVILIVAMLAGCVDTPDSDSGRKRRQRNSGTEATEENTKDIESTELEAMPVITDYSITGMMNVTDVYFSAVIPGQGNCKVDPEEATGITVWIMCPLCYEEMATGIDFSDIPENLIGQQTFTWTDDISCFCDYFSGNKYSILFTLNG